MRRHDQRSSNHESALAIWGPVMVAAGIMVTGFLGTLAVLQMDAFRPHLGDMVVFRPRGPDADPWQIRVTATEVAGRAGDATCTLKPQVMATAGGSLVVEARRETSPPLYRLHWAGTRTEEGPGDCGSAADFTLTRRDLQKVANAAGGFGLHTGAAAP
ncbi:MAG: hypothetical protein BGO51_16350 [Rhodospirillales bacterium 69-11]|nr:hypothetical protein [Rhodospirillales bacterium]OJW28896.1 MAG: hypothetical protein BGO51_16350 [Rhodospirillales bacterium 69-11]